MVKNIPTIERSTKIRIGKNTTDDQGENTIVLNASNTTINASSGGSLYISPVRLDTEYISKPEVVLMMYNTETKEIVESGVRASDIVGDQGLAAVTNQGNVTADVVRFVNNTTAFVTESNVGIANSTPGHTLSVGSNLYVDDAGSNVLVVTGGVSIDGNLVVNGGVTTITNVGVLNTNPIHTLDVGSNLYVDDVGSNILVVTGNTNITGDLTVDTDTLFVDSSANKIGVKTTNPDAELHVVGNVYVSSNLTVDEGTLHVDVENDSIGVGTVTPSANLHVVGNVYVSSNLTVDEGTLHVDVENDSIGVGTVTPSANLHVVGNVYVSSNLTVDGGTLHVDVENDSIGVGTVTPSANLHVVGNVYVSSNLTVDEGTLHVDVENDSIGVGTVTPSANLHVIGNVYVSSNIQATTYLGDGGLLSNVTLQVVSDHGNTTTNTIEFKNSTTGLVVDSNIVVGGNVTATTYLGDGGLLSNVTLQVVSDHGNTTSNTLQFTNAHTAFTTDLTSNVEVKLDQLANVVIGEKALANEDMLVYDGSNWTNQLQNHTFLYAKAGETIDKGDAVYATGAIGNNMFSIQKAQANSSATMPALGVAYQDFALNQEGLIVTFGRADGINTDNFQTGETVYVSNVTAGALSNVKPYGATDLIQNIGLVVKGHPSTGIVSVTGVGRSNDIPNAPIVADEGDINYVYVNDANNDIKKILPTNLLTQLQTLQQVTDTGNTTSNTIQFTNTTTGLVTVSNVEVGSNISVAGLTDAVNKHVPMVGTDGFLEKSPIYFTPGGTYVVSAAEAEFLGNLTLSGNTTILNSESVTISDRIFGVAANNSASQLDSGFMIEHQQGDPLEYANVALIYHADEHRFSISYTQNTFTDDHILHYEDQDHQILIDLRGNTQIQNNTTIGETLDVTGAVTFADDLTVGLASNLFVDVSSSRVGINEASPGASLDVGGDARVQSTTDTATRTAGALIVSGGLGVASNIHSTNVYAVSHVGVGTDAASAPLHLLVSGTGETTNGIYMKSAAGSATNDAIVNLEVAADGGDAFVTWNASGGDAFAMGLDRSESLLTIANSSSDLTTNARLQMATDGAVTLTNATNATSKTTGALIVGGGVGISGDIHATHANFEDVEADSVNVTDTTTSTSTTTGALKVAGGVSTQEKLNVGGVTKVWDSTAVTGKTDGALVVVGGVGISGNIHATHANFEDVEADSVNVTDTTTSTSTTTGALKVAGGVSTQEKLNVGGVTKVWDSTAATSKTDGALVVVGGVGISGATFGAAATFDGVTSITNATAATSKTNGALIVGGGVGISGDVYATNGVLSGNFAVDTDTLVVDAPGDRVGINTATPEASLHVIGNTYVSSNLTVGETTLHVDYQTSNVGIGKTDPAFTLDIAGDLNFSGAFYEDGVPFISSPWTIGGNGDLSYTSGNVTVDTTTLHVDSQTSNVGIGTTNPGYKLDVNGDIYATGNITAYSDKRAKSDIQKIENALDKIDQLNGYTFTMNDKRYTGVIAQEVLPVLPEAVTGSEETNYAVAYGNMMGLIIEAIKELKEKIG